MVVQQHEIKSPAKPPGKFRRFFARQLKEASHEKSSYCTSCFGGERRLSGAGKRGDAERSTQRTAPFVEYRNRTGSLGLQSLGTMLVEAELLRRICLLPTSSSLLFRPALVGPLASSLASSLVMRKAWEATCFPSPSGLGSSTNLPVGLSYRAILSRCRWRLTTPVCRVEVMSCALNATVETAIAMQQSLNRVSRSSCKCL